MIKLRNIILLMTAFILVSVMGFSENMGKIVKYSEQIIPKSGDDAVISITVEGETNEAGILYLPFYEKCELTRLNVVKGSLENNTGIEKNVYGKKCIEYKFTDKNASVSIEQEYLLKGLYKGKKAKMKNSYPGGIVTVSYLFSNNTPVSVNKYSLAFSFPKGAELYGVLSPSKSKYYNVSVNDGYKTVFVSNKKINSGDDYKVSVNIYKQSTMLKIVIWISVLVIALFMLYKRKDIFKEES